LSIFINKKNKYTSGIPDPDAYGANTLTNRTANNENKTAQKI
jgi:hypothetical protein